MNRTPGQVECASCLKDVSEMENALRNRGFEVDDPVLDARATKATVLRKLRELASRSKEGDLALVYYSGHGTQVPDENRDESDGQDEAWVLQDRLLVDDELVPVWETFAEGVTVVLLNDSCYAPPVIQLASASPFTATAPPGKGRVKSIQTTTPSISIRPPEPGTVVRVRPDGNKDTDFQSGRKEPHIRCRIVALSACDDGKTAKMGLSDQCSVFTAAVLKVLSDSTFSGGYVQFLDKVRLTIVQDAFDAEYVQQPQIFYWPTDDENVLMLPPFTPVPVIAYGDPEFKNEQSQPLTEGPGIASAPAKVWNLNDGISFHKSTIGKSKKGGGGGGNRGVVMAPQE